jgi:hypothetical protein
MIRINEPWALFSQGPKKELIFLPKSLVKQKLTETNFLLLQEYQQYKILIADKPLSPKYQPEAVEDDGIQLRKINSLAE